MASQSVNTHSSIINWQERPQQGKEIIAETYQRLSQTFVPDFPDLPVNDSFYAESGLNIYDMMLGAVSQLPEEQHKFNMMVIGTHSFAAAHGCFQLAYIDDRLTAKKVTIFALKAERSKDYEALAGTAEIYATSRINLECIGERFGELKDKIDLIVMKTRSFIDPIGTLSQLYDLLKPQTGQLHLATDDIHFKGYVPDLSLIQIISKDRFLLKKNACQIATQNQEYYYGGVFEGDDEDDPAILVNIAFTQTKTESFD